MYVCRMESVKSIRLSDEHYEMAIKDAKDIGLNFTSYIRYLIVKENKKKEKQNELK